MSEQHINHEQLAMFMPAHRLLEMKLGDQIKGESKDDMMARKRISTKENGWDFSGGVKEPVEIFHSPTNTRLLNGHNRLTAAYSKVVTNNLSASPFQIGRKIVPTPNTEVPVQHTDAMNYSDMQDHRMKAGAAALRRQMVRGTYYDDK